MKTWHIKTWGAGTPHYLVSAPTKEEAWEMVEKEWRKDCGTYHVGEDYYGRGLNKHQTIEHLIEVVGLTTQTQMIIDLNK